MSTPSDRMAYGLSAFLAIVLATGTGQMAQAGWAWIGGGTDTHWGTAANWDKSADNTNGTGGYFRDGMPHGANSVSVVSYDVSWANANVWNYNFYVDRGSTRERPFTFSADGDASYGHTGNGALNIGTTGGSGTGASGWGDGYLSILSGTYLFNGANLGQSANNPTSQGWLSLGTNEDSVSFTSTNAFRVYNGGLAINNATWNHTSGPIHFGQAVNSTVTVENNGGSVTTLDDIWIAYGDGANVVITNAGNWTVSAGHSIGVGNGSGSTVSIVNKSGSWDVSGGVYLGNGNGSTVSVYHKGGTLTVANSFYIGNNASANPAYFELSGGTVNSTKAGGCYAVVGMGSEGTLVVKDGATFNVSGIPVVGHTSTGTVVVQNGGKLLANSNKMYVGEMATSSGTLTVKDGGVVEVKNNEVILCHYQEKSKGVINLESGGLLHTRNVTRGFPEFAAMTFDGGTLKGSANGVNLIDSGILVTVGANGGTIDTSGNSVTIAGDIADKAGESGFLKFTGGAGTVTLSGAADWTGGTGVDLGMKIVAPTDAATNAVLCNLVVDCRTKVQNGDYTVFECNEVLTEDVLANVTCLEHGGTATVGLGDGGKSIVVHYVAPPCIGTTPVKVWSDITLDDIKYATFTSRFVGSSINNKAYFYYTFDSATGYCKKLFADENSGSVTNIVVEFQVLDDGYTKCVVVSFTNGDGGVYAKGLGAAYVGGSDLGHSFYPGPYNGTLASTPTASGYGVCNLNVKVEEATEWTLDQNRTWSELRDGAALSADSLVRILVTGDSPVLTIDENVDVAKIEIMNALAAGGVSTNSISVSDGVTVSYGEFELKGGVCLAVGGFVPTGLTLDAGSKVLYASGESVCASMSGAGGIEVAPGATLYVDEDSSVGYILNNGTIVKRVAADVSIPFHNGSRGVIMVTNGKLKASGVTAVGGNPYGFVTESEPNANQLVVVKSGAAYDLNGIYDITASVRLEEGGRMVNSGGNVDGDKMQTVQLILDGDAAVTTTGEFGLLAPRHNATRLDLGSHTLTLDGTSHFWLSNTTIVGDGEIVVSGGTLVGRTTSSGADCTLTIGENGTLKIYSSRVLTVKNFFNGGTMYNDAGTLEVTGTLTPGNPLTKLTLADGATVKVTGVANAQTVSSAFSASGTITVDASAITSADLREAGRVPVLTVPSSFDPSGATWNVYSPNTPKRRLSWETDAGGSTKTLYLCKASGLMTYIM